MGQRSRRCAGAVWLGSVFVLGLLDSVCAAEVVPVEYGVALDTVRRGYDGEYCWVHPNAGIVPRGPAQPPSIILVMQRLWLKGSDVIYAINEMRTENFGRTWTGPYEHTESLGRRTEASGLIVVPGDFRPKWHAASGKLLGIGHTVRYRGDVVAHMSPRETVYSVYDPEKRVWAPFRPLLMPDPTRHYSAGAGGSQRVDLPNGDILLPLYIRPEGESDFRSLVARCRFDGATLTAEELGNELAIDGGRGFNECSLARFGERFFLTFRNDEAGYVAVSQDGLRFERPRIWTWDDGTELGNYNTQQHWVTHRDGLFLVYTRRGASNDHVMRHRAPLFIAQVDPERLVVVRATERILVPERGARLGCFGVTDVSPDETWVTVAEWMQRASPIRDWAISVGNARGADNSVYAARILWKESNEGGDF